MTYHEGRPGPGSETADRLDTASSEEPGHQGPGTQSPGIPTSPLDAPEQTSTADTAKEEASKLVGEARRQIGDLTGQTRGQLTSHAREQKDRAVGGLRALSEELHTMSGGSTQPGVAGDLAQEAARRTDDLASWLEGREPGELIEELRTFARRRPGLFLALAAGAGVVAGRLTRGMAQPAAQQGTSS
jgi:hypothetical protein